MEGEINNFIFVCTVVLASLCYCNVIGKLLPTSGLARPLSILPIISLFFVLPLNLTTLHLGATCSFLIAWLANFKLILFAFNKGPLHSNPPIPLRRFIIVACFPIKFQGDINSKSTKNMKSPLNFAAKVVLFAIVLHMYTYTEFFHQKIILSLYALQIYLMLEILLYSFAIVTRGLCHVGLERQFDEPYLATSLQDFWGRRWNLMVSNILHPTIYEPVRSVSARFFSKEWASIPGVLASFLVSGLMHELVFYNFGRIKPDGEVMCFFVLHGVSLSVEIILKKLLGEKFRVPGIISGPLTLIYVLLTSFWLFFPPFLRGKPQFKGCTETLAIMEFLRYGRLVGPNDLPCSYF